MKCLVVGGAGFIGSHLSQRLLDEGHAVTIVDNLLTGQIANVPAGAVFHRMSGLDPAFGGIGDAWDAIFHLGGASSAPMFDERPQHAGEAVALFQGVLELACRAQAPVAFASTSSFYARCEKPYREEMHVTPATLYEASKLSMEHLAQAYASTYGLDVTAFRFFSVYGPNEQSKGRYANIVSQFLWCLRSGIRPVVYGDGSQTRDFTHVDDLIDAILLAYPRTRGFEAYNIGTGAEHTFSQVLDKLGEALGVAADPVFVANPIRNYVDTTQADATKLLSLGWMPSVGLDDGIRRLVHSGAALRPTTIEAMRRAHPAYESVQAASSDYGP